jgi:hypothetical protein
MSCSAKVLSRVALSVVNVRGGPAMEEVFWSSSFDNFGDSFGPFWLTFLSPDEEEEEEEEEDGWLILG